MSFILSIVIPTLNRPDLLKSTVSILAGAIKRFNDRGGRAVELIISDNASDAPEMKSGAFSRWAEGEAFGIPLRIVRFENRVEIDDSFQRSAKLASGDYIWVFGDDDYLLYGGLDAVVDFLVKHPETELLHFATLVADPTMQKGSFLLLGEMGSAQFMTGRELLFHSLFRPGFITSFVCRRLMWNKEFDFVEYAGYGFFVMLFSQIMDRKVAYLPQPCVIMRQSNAVWKPNWGRYLFVTMPKILTVLASDRTEECILVRKYQEWYCSGFGYVYNLLNCKSYGLFGQTDVRDALQKYQSKKNVFLFRVVDLLVPKFIALWVTDWQQRRKFCCRSNDVD